MREQTIQDQVSSIILKIECRKKLKELMFSGWATYGAFLHQNGWLPDRLEDVSATTFKPFVNYCMPPHMDEKTLFETLAAVWIILARAGHRIESLTGLSVLAVREREANDQNGKYRYRKILKDPAA